MVGKTRSVRTSVTADSLKLKMSRLERLEVTHKQVLFMLNLIPLRKQIPNLELEYQTY